MNEIFAWITGRMILTGQTKVPGERAVSVPLCLPQIPHGPAWNQTWTFAVKGQPLTEWHMARPVNLLLLLLLL